MAVLEKKETKAALVRRLLRNPAFDADTVPQQVQRMHAAGYKNIKLQDVYTQRMKKKRKKAVRKPISSSKAAGKDANGDRTHRPATRQTEVFQADLTIPSGGLVIKLTRQKRKVGTLAISDTGFMFVRANGKKLPNRELKWEHLSRLFESGLLG